MATPTEPERGARREAERAERHAAIARQRRLLAGGVAAVAAVVAVIGVVAGSGGDAGPSPGEEIAAVAACPDEIVADPDRLVGHKLLVRMEATATEGLRRKLRRGEIAGVVLFPPEGTDSTALGREVAKLHAAAAAGGMAPAIVAIDQEGGEVKRLADAPPDRAPAELAGAGTAEAGAQGRATGAALAALGINVDLAPVLDVAEATDSFIASRTFGADPVEVATLGVAFGEGLQAEGVAATAKHFPGLGLAAANTDDEPSVIDATKAELEPGLGPFRAAAKAPFELIMAANALYPAYDAELPASLSPKLIDGLLRERLGYAGVVVTDDLGAGAITGAGYDEGEAAVASAKAGADLLLFALSGGGEASRALSRALLGGELDEGSLVASCARVEALRRRLISGF